MKRDNEDQFSPDVRGRAPWMASAVRVLAVSAFGALPLFGHVGVLEVVALVGIATTSTLIAWQASRAAHAARVCGAPEVASGKASESLSPLLVSVLPVWQEHVGTVKSQTESAINELALSFASISEQFGAAGFLGANGDSTDGQEASMSLLTLCERQLQPVVASMTHILDSKGSLVSCVHDLSHATIELQNMASGVGQIAAQTNLLAINAAIEAARVGDAGRGFAVIAKEIRSLSQVSAQTGKQITERMVQVSKIMKNTVDAAAKASEHDQSAIKLSGDVIDDVLTHVREMSGNAEKMRGQGNVIRAEVDKLMVNLQFQDRVSQLISVIDTDIARLKDALEGDLPLPSAQEWLDELQSHYTMPDQRRGHVSGDSVGCLKAAPPAAAKAIFF